MNGTAPGLVYVRPDTAPLTVGDQVAVYDEDTETYEATVLEVSPDNWTLHVDYTRPTD